MSIQFNDTNLEFDVGQNKKQRPLSHIHIRVIQRNKTKMITHVEGLAEDLDFSKILKVLKKKFNTNGAVINSDDGSQILQLNGDKREDIRRFFVDYKVWEEPDPPIVIHGA